ncbi:hypothetical protein OG937_02320 [Streptomyces sp. NBC_00510]
MAEHLVGWQIERRDVLVRGMQPATVAAVLVMRPQDWMALIRGRAQLSTIFLPPNRPADTLGKAAVASRHGWRSDWPTSTPSHGVDE